MHGHAVAHSRVLSLCCIGWFDLTCALDGKAEARPVTHLVQAVLGADSLDAALLRSLSNPIDRGRLGGAGWLHAAATVSARFWRGSAPVCAWIVLAGIAQETQQPAKRMPSWCARCALPSSCTSNEPFWLWVGWGCRFSTTGSVGWPTATVSQIGF